MPLAPTLSRSLLLLLEPNQCSAVQCSAAQRVVLGEELPSLVAPPHGHFKISVKPPVPRRVRHQFTLPVYTPLFSRRGKRIGDHAAAAIFLLVQVAAGAGCESPSPLLSPFAGPMRQQRLSPRPAAGEEAGEGAAGGDGAALGAPGRAAVTLSPTWRTYSVFCCGGRIDFIRSFQGVAGAAPRRAVPLSAGPGAGLQHLHPRDRRLQAGGRHGLPAFPACPGEEREEAPRVPPQATAVRLPLPLGTSSAA
jgi:hypothetical protein